MRSLKSFVQFKVEFFSGMTNLMTRTLLSVAAITLVGVVIYYGILSKAPLPDRHWLRGKNDLALHAIAFFSLSPPMLVLWPRLMTVIGLASLAAVVEGAQLWIPRRTPDMDDILASLAGVLLGAAVVWGLHRALGHGSDR